jgi:hypothetical protein
MNRTAFILSVALTAFVLLLTGGVVTAVRARQEKAAITPTPTVETVAEPTIDPAIQQAFDEREQAYQDLIAQANARLDQLQQANQSLQLQLNAMQSAPTAEAPAAVASGVTPEEAAQIAARYLNRTDLYSVEGAQFNGVSAYLVTFSSGDLVYVSLDGQVLSVQLAKGQIASGGGGGGREHDDDEHEHEDEHEDHDDD